MDKQVKETIDDMIKMITSCDIQKATCDGGDIVTPLGDAYSVSITFTRIKRGENK